VIVSCSLPLNAENTELVLGHTISGAEALAKRVPGAEVVAAFNNVPSEVLFGVFESRGKAARQAWCIAATHTLGKPPPRCSSAMSVSIRSMWAL
jgi:predicted dinucleotide-binding enzyme